MNRAFERAIANYMRRGGNETEGRELLAAEVKHFTPDNLPVALLYHGFVSTPTAARRMAADLNAARKEG